MQKKGLLQVYTGDGKGKTTAALGLSLRALGHGWRVAVIQFMKNGLKYGETTSLKMFSNCTLLQYGRDTLVNLHNPDPIDVELAQQGLSAARGVIEAGSCDLLILDELNVAMAVKLLSENEVLTMLQCRPDHMEIVVTGRYAPQSILDLADLVTEMRQIKHPFEKGIDARQGIEY